MTHHMTVTSEHEHCQTSCLMDCPWFFMLNNTLEIIPQVSIVSFKKINHTHFEKSHVKHTMHFVPVKDALFIGPQKLLLGCFPSVQAIQSWPSSTNLTVPFLSSSFTRCLFFTTESCIEIYYSCISDVSGFLIWIILIRCPFRVPHALTISFFPTN